MWDKKEGGDEEIFRKHVVWKSPQNSHSTFRYVYILSGQKLIKNAKNGQFLRALEKKRYQTGPF